MCEAMNFLRQATIPERLYLGRITSTARYNLTPVPQGSHTALLTNDSVTVGLCPRWNRLKRTKHVFQRSAARRDRCNQTVFDCVRGAGGV